MTKLLLPPDAVALIADMDGTIARCNSAHCEAGARALASFGIDFEIGCKLWQEAARAAGVSQPFYRDLLRAAGDLAVSAGLIKSGGENELPDRHKQVTEELAAGKWELVSLVEPLPGAAELISAAHEGRLKIALLSYTPIGLSRAILRQVGIEKCFDLIQCADKTGRNNTAKMHGPCWQEVACEIGVAAEQYVRVVAITDTAQDVLGAQEAGFHVFCLPSSEKTSDTLRAANLPRVSVLSTWEDLIFTGN